MMRECLRAMTGMAAFAPSLDITTSSPFAAATAYAISIFLQHLQAHSDLTYRIRRQAAGARCLASALGFYSHLRLPAAAITWLSLRLWCQQAPSERPAQGTSGRQ